MPNYRRFPTNNYYIHDRTCKKQMKIKTLGYLKKFSNYIDFKTCTGSIACWHFLLNARESTSTLMPLLLELPALQLLALKFSSTALIYQVYKPTF